MEESYFELTAEFNGANFLGLEGCWGKKVKVTVINVYAPCDLREMRLCWEEIVSHMESRGDKWCILGNSIKDMSKRKGVDGNNRSEEIQLFGILYLSLDLLIFPSLVGSTCGINQMVHL